MFVSLLSFLAAQIIFGIIFSCIGLLKVRQRMLALREEIAAGDTSVQTYQRFAAARRRITYPPLKVFRILLFGLIMSIVAHLVVFSRTFDLPVILASLDVFWLILFLLLFFLAQVIGYEIGWLVFSLVGTFVVDAETVRVFRLSRLQRRELLTLSLRSALLTTLPLILCLEAVALPFLLAAPLAVFLSANPLPGEMPFDRMILLFCLALWVGVIVVEVVHAVFDAPLYAFTNVLQPMTQTPWADLAPRIAAYARLAGVEFSSIQVRQDLPGTFSITLSGLGKPMLIISEFFLRHSEWRQQDALVSLAIGLVKKRVIRHALVSKLVSSVLVGVLLLLWLLLSVVFPQGLEPSIILLFLLLPLIGIWAVVKGSSSYFRRLQSRNYREANCIASFLTGDPVALMVAFDVLLVFNGERPDHASERMRQLDELAHQSWPHAPQASLPVPTACALGFDSLYLSTSLDQATSPGPVPTTPYQNLPD